MKFKFFHIDAQEPLAAEEEMNAFCAQHRVVAVEKQFVSQGAGSFWAVCVSYLQQGAAKLLEAGSKRDAVDYKEVLNAADFAVFSELRLLRKTLADRDGAPVYAVFSNRQLADMVRGRMNSLSALGTLEGVGQARLDKYGEAFVQALKAAFAPLPQIQAPPSDETQPHPAQ